MTFNVYYTHRAQADSSFVNRVWFDGTRSRLAVELSGVVYEYDDVDEETYYDLLEAYSVGNYYRRYVQGRYTGLRLGPVADLVEVDVNAKPAVQDATRAETIDLGSLQPVGSEDKGLLAVSRVPLAGNPTVNTAVLTLDYTLHFVLDGQTEERSHTLKAVDLDDAIEQMFELAELLDKPIIVKGASVRFE